MPTERNEEAPAPSSRKLTRGRDTKQLILDAAEALISEHGVDGVSMRDITGRAGVRLALANYHFLSRDALIRAVVARRADEMACSRLAALAEIKGKPSPEGILRAFINPYLKRRTSTDIGWRNYSFLVAEMAANNRWLPLLEELFNPTALVFLDALYAALPRAPKPVVARAFVFAMQLMISALAETRRVDGLSRGSVSSEDIEATYDSLMQFVVAGFESLCGAAPSTGRPHRSLARSKPRKPNIPRRR
jgi:AcrR family transcriptional regulator